MSCTPITRLDIERHGLIVFTIAMCLNDTTRQDLSSTRTYKLPQLSCLRPRRCRATQHHGRSAGPPAATGHTDRVILHDGTLDAYFLTFFQHKHFIHAFIARLGGLIPRFGVGGVFLGHSLKRLIFPRLGMGRECHC